MEKMLIKSWKSENYPVVNSNILSLSVMLLNLTGKLQQKILYRHFLKHENKEDAIKIHTLLILMAKLTPNMKFCVLLLGTLEI